MCLPIDFSPNNIIEINSLSKRYNNNLVIDRLNLVVRRGDFVSIVGRFGSGKTTILKIISGLINAYEGMVTIDGLSPVKARSERKIGFVFQKPTLLPWKSVLDNVRMPHVISGSVNEEKIHKLIDAANLSRYTHIQADKLSGGTKQLVSIITALAQNPEIMLLDEAFSAIDEINREEIYDLITEFHKVTGTTILLVTHSIEEAVLLSDKVVVLSRSPARVIDIVDVDRQTKCDNTEESRSFIDTITKIKQLLRDEDSSNK